MIKHGHTPRGKCSPTYYSWLNMKSRCYCSSSRGYYNYGARGIKVCDRWLHNFSTFLADMGERPEGRSLDRIDGSKDYTPENCRWATRVEQNRNSNRNRLVEYNGERRCVSEWAQRLNLPVSTLAARLFYYGWPIEDALTSNSNPTPRHSGLRR